MSYGKLGTIKTVGNKPVFCILDAKDQPIIVVPDVEDWMMKKVGHKFSIFVSTKHFQLTDVDEE